MKPFDLTGYRIEVRFEARVVIGEIRSMGFYKTREEASGVRYSLPPKETLVLTMDGDKFFPLGEEAQTSG